MHRVDDILPKIKTIVDINDGKLNLANRDLTMTSMLNTVLRAMIDKWPVAPISDRDADRLFPIIMRWTEATDNFEISRELVARAMDAGLADVVPFLIVRYLLRNHRLPVKIIYQTPEWNEFVNLYRPLFLRLTLMEKSHA